MVHTPHHTLLTVLLLAIGAQAAALQCSSSNSNSISVTWDPSPEFNLYYVQISQSPTKPPISLETTIHTSLNFTRIASGKYTLTLRGLPKSAPSLAWGPAWSIIGSVDCSTTTSSTPSLPPPPPPPPPLPPPQQRSSIAAAPLQYTRSYRISEYSFDVDFLRNHDSASQEAAPLYLQTCSTDGTCTPFDATVQSPNFFECHDALQKMCPGERGKSFDCMKCANENHDALSKICGNFTNHDSLQPSGNFAVHFWCGIGWPESAAIQGPITEYCVEHLLVPTKVEKGSPTLTKLKEDAVEDAVVGNVSHGFSDYLSCNSDEVEGWYGATNNAHDPKCMCIVYADRLLSHQTKNQLDQDCYVNKIPWVEETVCNCSGAAPGGGEIPMAGNPSLKYVGRAPVYLPYVAYKLIPANSYIQKASGFNYHFPKDGMCPEGVAVGTNGCTWRRLPRARMLYGQDLLDHGWDTSFVPDTLHNQSHTIANKEAFKRAWKAFDLLVGQDPCGDV